MIIEVTKENVTIKELSVINEGEVCVNKCKFNLPECFDDLKVTAAFNNIPVPLVNGECTIPALKKGTATLGVYAYKENDDGIELMYSPRPTVFLVSEGSFSEEVNEEAVCEVSIYEQYCKMIADRYVVMEENVNEAEAQRRTAEAERVQAFSQNEAYRQRTFESSEYARNAQFVENEAKRSRVPKTTYTNLLKTVAQEDSTTMLPTVLPAHKTGVYYNKDTSGLVVNEELDCYFFEIDPGDRLQVSRYTFASVLGGSMLCILDKNFVAINNFNTINVPSVLGGTFPMPENAKYVAINTVRGADAPYVTLVDELILETNDTSISSASKFIAPQTFGKQIVRFECNAEGYLTALHRISNMNANGIYPLQPFVEYVIYMPEVTAEHYSSELLYFIDNDFKVNSIVTATSFQNGRYVFTPQTSDVYVAINEVDSLGEFQFGRNRPQYITKSVEIGNAVFDGKNPISVKDLGITDRNLKDVKWVSYGDSITFGVGVNFVRGEKLWQDYIVERYGIGSHVKMGVGYSSLACNKTNTENAFCNDARLDALVAETPDIVTILGGANDYIFNIPIGTLEDVTNKNIETFKGAYAYILDRILTAKPDTIIVLLGMFLNTLGSYKPNPSKLHQLKEYAVATKEIAEHFGLPFVDLNECGFNSYNFNTTDGVFSTDGIHPNKEGVKRMAMVISGWFDSFKNTVFFDVSQT